MIKEELESIIQKYEKEKGASISIKIADIKEEFLYDYHSEEQVNSASVIKIGILMAVLEKVKQKQIELDTIIEFDSYELKGYEGIYQEKEKRATLLELLTFMIILSDNVATNIVIDLFGFKYYNQYFKEQGYQNTCLNRYMGMYDDGLENYTSNQDMYHMIKAIFENKIATKELCTIARNILERQRGKTASQRYIYEDINVYHKTGGLSYLNLKNDCGCFEKDGHFYYFGFFIEGAESKEEASKLIGKLFRKCYDSI